MRILILLLALTFFFPTRLHVLAVDEVNIEVVNPDSIGAYKIKRLKEKIGLLLRFWPQSKADYMLILLDRRFSELKYTSENKDIAHIEKVSQRYETTAGQLAEYIVQKKLDPNSALERFDNQKEIINEIITNFTFGTAEWRFVMNDINSLTEYSRILIEFSS